MSGKVSFSYAVPEDPLLKKIVIKGIEVLTGRKKLEKLYSEILETDPSSEEIWGAMMEKLRIPIEFDENQFAKIPSKGPLIIISNHPFGVVDGLALGYLISKVRRDFTVIVNEVLCREERLANNLLAVDFRETKEALQINLNTRKESLERLKAGEVVALFPAGGVATSKSYWGKAEDLDWKRFVAKMIQMTKAPVVPLFFYGQNSRLFQIVSQVSMNLRLGLLMNEARNKMGRPLRIEIGDPISYDQLAEIKNRQILLDHLRFLTEGLERK